MNMTKKAFSLIVLRWLKELTLQTFSWSYIGIGREKVHLKKNFEV